MEKQTEQLEEQKLVLNSEIQKAEAECKEQHKILETEKAIEKKKNEKYEQQLEEAILELKNLEKDAGSTEDQLDQELIQLQNEINRTDKQIGETNSNKIKLDEKDNEVVNEKSLKNQKATLEMKLESQQKELFRQEKEFESYKALVMDLKKRLEPFIVEKQKQMQQIQEKEEEVLSSLLIYLFKQDKMLKDIKKFQDDKS